MLHAANFGWCRMLGVLATALHYYHPFREVNLPKWCNRMRVAKQPAEVASKGNLSIIITVQLLKGPLDCLLCRGMFLQYTWRVSHC